jgi:hypothetical protein
MDFDTGILSLIEGYVDGALSSTGTKRALIAAPKLDTQFEGDTIPDVKATPSLWYEDFDELTTAVVVRDQQRLIR